MFSVAVCLMWLYQHVISVSYISRKGWVLCILLLCSLMMCAYSRALTLIQCTLAGPVYIGMPLECHRATGLPLDYHWLRIRECIMALSRIRVCTSNYLIIIITQTHMKVLHFESSCQVILPQVCVWYSVNSHNNLSCNIWGCAYWAHSFLLYTIVIIRILYVIIIIKSEWRPISHCSGLGHETMVCNVFIFIFL